MPPVPKRNLSFLCESRNPMDHSMCKFPPGMCKCPCHGNPGDIRDRFPDETDASYAARILGDMAERWNIDGNAVKALIRHLRFLMTGNSNGNVEL